MALISIWTGNAYATLGTPGKDLPFGKRRAENICVCARCILRGEKKISLQNKIRTAVLKIAWKGHHTGQVCFLVCFQLWLRSEVWTRLKWNCCLIMCYYLGHFSLMIYCYPILQANSMLCQTIPFCLAELVALLLVQGTFLFPWGSMGMQHWGPNKPLPLAKVIPEILEWKSKDCSWGNKATSQGEFKQLHLVGWRLWSRKRGTGSEL